MNSRYTIRARNEGAEVLIYDEIGAYGVGATGHVRAASIGWQVHRFEVSRP